MTLDEYDIEIDEIDQHHVVLVIRALRLIVLGRTLVEAQHLASVAIGSHGQEVAPQRVPDALCLLRGRSSGNGEFGATA